MMSPRDALKSYRRAVRRAYSVSGRPPTHPLHREMGRRGDRLWLAFGNRGTDEIPIEVVDAMTTRDLRELERMDKEDDDACQF